MLEEQDWIKIQERVARNKHVQRFQAAIEKNKQSIEDRGQKKKELHQQIRDYNHEIRLLNGKIRSTQVTINGQDRAILACQKRIAHNEVKIKTARDSVIDRQEVTALNRKRREFRQKVLKDKVSEIWNTI
jgi:septal ring factor EnvC (AmiA/AmiB activator)